MKHHQAVQILDGLLKDSKFFQGLVAGREAYPIVLERHNMFRLLSDLSDLSRDHSIEILDTLFKDSKVFQGVALAISCHPFAKHAGKTRLLFNEIAHALMNVPEDDMFATPRRDGKPIIFAALYQCPLCSTTQTATSFNQACTGCGVFRYSAYTPALVRDALGAVDIPVDIQTIDDWSVEELEAAVLWAREAIDAHPKPEMPKHLQTVYDELERVGNTVATEDDEPTTNGADAEGNPLTEEALN